MEALRRIFVTSELLNDLRLSKDERQEITQRLKDQIQMLWKTDECARCIARRCATRSATDFITSKSVCSRRSR